MKFGINMLLWTTRVTAEQDRPFAAIRGAGADGVEIPLNETDVPECRALARRLEDLGLDRTSSMAILDPAQDPSSPDPARRRAALDLLKALIDRAAALGASVLCGPMYQPLGHFTGQGPTADERRHAADVVREAAAHAAAANVLLAIEPLNRFECHLLNTMDDAAAFADLVGHPSAGVLFDTFHANIEEQDPVGCIRRRGGSIRHVHLSASDRGIPGRDHVDWAGTFEALRAVGYDGWMVIESFGRALPGLAAATRIWRDLFASPEDVVREGLAFVRSVWDR
jgi:D-psicose/D-tagatose/L-ribulose 3-epimerase